MAAPKRHDRTEQRDAGTTASEQGEASALAAPRTLAGVLGGLVPVAASFAAFFGGAALVVAVVPETLRLAIAGAALAATGLATGVFGLVEARRRSDRQALADATARIDALVGERLSLARDNERLRDETWRLKESDARLRDVLDTLGDVVTRWRLGGEIVYANDAAQGLFPEGLAAALHGNADRTAREPLAGPVETTSGDILIETANGARWFARRDVAVRDGKSGEPLIQTMLRDVSDRRGIEDALVAARNQAEIASASKSRFLATVSHEIRTPLNGILGMAGLLRDTRLTAEQRSYVEAVRSSGEILLLLISEVLDLSRIEAGRLDLVPDEVEIASLAEGVVELLGPRAQSKGLEIGCFIAPDMPRRISIDPTRLRQILFNLAGNGLKFTETGGVEVSIETVSADASGSHRFAIAVRDTGIGFAAGEGERLFEEFEQVDHGPARRFDGAGLGLAISRRLARLMGGDVTAHSDPGKGACFRVELPLEVLEHAPDGLADLGAAQVVIVSASRIEAPLAARSLKAHGAQVALVTPGDEAGDEKLLAADLVLLDPACVADAGAWLAGARAVGVRAPAAALIAPADRDRLPRLREAGFGGYLIRPVRSASLVKLAHTLLGHESEWCPWEQASGTTQVAGQAPDTGDTATAPAPARPLRVLVADDNDINRMLSEALLRKLGHEPIVVGDGAEALDVAADGGFDLILMDLHMPVVDGVTAIRRFRAMEHDGKWSRIPVFAVTADVTPDAEEAALAAGADAVFAKPLDPDLLSRRITRERDSNRF
ncbi:ATP-binding protein [Stappia sp.]|uniref:ATP-binding protein n=1 Tax=Stappia sp. TaxID=1870903 RepID=UPI003D0EE2A5